MDDVFKNMPERDREAIMELMGADPEEYKRARAEREKIEKEIAEQRMRQWADAVSKAFAERTEKRYKVDGPKHFVFPKAEEPKESKEVVRVPRSWAQEKAAIEFLEEQRRLRRTQREAWEKPCELCGTLNDEIMCEFVKYTAYDQSETSRYTLAKFCPECGRPLTPEAQAMLEKRLRGNEI